MFMPLVLRPAAYVFAKLYELGVGARLQLYARGWLKTYRLPAPVISVGNLTVGGTGKTPCTAYLANLLTAAGFRVAILSRGYKRTTKGIVEVSDGERILCSPTESGDEPYLLARQCPGVRVVVGTDRYAAGMWLWQRAKVDVFLLDDGFQHVRLHRDVNLALIDAQEDLTQSKLLPLGHWREPVASLSRADAVILTRASAECRAGLKPALHSAARFLPSGAPVMTATHELGELRYLPDKALTPLSQIKAQPVFALTAIAQPQRFIEDLRQQGLNVIAQQTFADHHRYTLVEIENVIVAAQQAGAAVILTTEKDAANLPEELWQRELPLPIYAVQLRFQVIESDALQDFVLSRIQPQPQLS